MERARERESRTQLERREFRGRQSVEKAQVGEKERPVTLCGCVEFDSRSKYSIRDEISRRPSPCGRS